MGPTVSFSTTPSFPRSCGMLTPTAPAGNATGYLVPNQGITIISDIDDILRITKIYQPKEGLLNTFARDMIPWLNMPEVTPLPPTPLNLY